MTASVLKQDPDTKTVKKQADRTIQKMKIPPIFIIGDKFLNTCRLNSGWAQDCVLTQPSKDYPRSSVVTLEGQKLSEAWDLWESRQTDGMLGGWMMSNFWLKSASHCRCQCSTKKVRFQAFTRLKYFWKKSDVRIFHSKSLILLFRLMIYMLMIHMPALASCFTPALEI